jgi:hypothetical protein
MDGPRSTTVGSRNGKVWQSTRFRRAIREPGRWLGFVDCCTMPADLRETTIRKRQSMYRTFTLTLYASALLLSFSALAQKPAGEASREAFYRCRSTTGQTLYGDSMPFGCQGQDTEVLNARGIQLRMIEGEKTHATRIAREAQEAKALAERNEQAQRDRVLNETYLTVADIERLRDQRLEMLAGQYRLTEQNMDGLRERQKRLAAQVARFKPYADNPSAPPLPDHLAEEMVNTVNGLKVYEETLVKNRDEQSQVIASFGDDIKRFKHLKGIK